MIQQFSTLQEMMQAFGDEQRCIDHLRAIRWADGAYCPYCGCKRVYHFKDGRNHKCKDCGKRFSIKVGTIFEDSKVPLSKWFTAIWLATSHKKGIASAQLARDIGVTQKTAWFMLHRLRHAAKTRSFNQPLAGTIEVDETYVGGKETNKHAGKRTKGAYGRSTKTKTPVIGILKRGGEIRAKVLSNVSAAALMREIGHNVQRKSRVCTDEFIGYAAVGGFGYRHTTVRHVGGVYVGEDGASVNGVENFWSLLKRMIVGIYHNVSPKHLQRYVDELSYRFNHRQDGEEQRVNRLLAMTSGRRLTYAGLTA